MAITEKQRLAIESEGNVLVSASAGAGKTFVMMERIKRLILDKGVDVDKILCVTFTVLAAKEMKEKLATTITQALKDFKGEKRQKLEKQLDLLPTASISTIHAFCKGLLSEFFYEVGLDPTFTILDDKNTKLLVNRAIDRLFEDLYEEKDEDLALLLPLFFKKRKDRGLKEKIVSVYYLLISEANPEDILNGGEFYYTEEGIDYLADYFLNELTLRAEKYRKDCAEMASNATAYQKLYNYLKKLEECFLQISFTKDYTTACNAYLNLPLRKPNRNPKASEEELYIDDLVGALNERIKNFVKMAKNKMLVDLTQEKTLVKESKKVYLAIKNITLKFMEYFAREKHAENAVDYSDLEHFTLKLLQNEDVRQEISSRYEYLFTDEYQDTSGVQEGILTAIAKDNLFMVGDVKQSIYDFRGCNPDIFANKYKKYTAGEGGTAINLDRNFRSTKKVLDSVNSLFSAVMTERCGNVDYKNNPMQVGASYPLEEGETLMCSVKKSECEKILPEGVYSVTGHLKVLRESKVFAEAICAVDLINELIGQDYYDIKSGKIKRIEYGDIALLLRDANKDADAYASYFERAQIPYSAPSKDSIANYPEVKQMVDILRLINCYNQDIELASALKSELGKVSDKELLSIRKACPQGSFVDAVNEYRITKSDDLSQKLQDFDCYFNGIRTLAEFTPCGELLAKIVSDNGIDVKLLATPLGEVKLARLNKFIEVAQSSNQTVSEFLIGIEGLLEKLTMSYANKNAVQILSIHASKGLEYPIVILGKISKKFNAEGIKGDFLADRYYGVSLNHRNLSNMVMSESLFNKFVKYVKTKRMREEEMRLLYVAMTRAKNSLYLLYEYSNDEKCEPAPYHGEDVYDCANYFSMFAQGDVQTKICQNTVNTFAERKTRQVLIGDADEYMVQKIEKNLSFIYPNLNRSSLSVKRSVTSAAHFEEEGQTQKEISPIYSEITTETGNAYHKLLEVCDFSLSPEDAFNRAIDGDLIEEEYKKIIEKDKAIKILSMPIFSKINKFTLYKEQPFTAFMPATMVEGEYEGNEEVLIQGIIDLLAIEGEYAYLIDYKYSSVTSDEKLIQRYKKQLELYAYAVEKVLKKKVVKSYLINVNTCKAIEVY